MTRFSLTNPFFWVVLGVLSGDRGRGEVWKVRI